MTNLFERSFLMALGAAVLTKEMAESVANELVKKGGSATDEGRKLLDETVEQAKQETRGLKTRMDEAIERNFKEMGLVTSDELDELNLKIAQLEHRLSLLESGRPAAAAAETATGKSQAAASLEELPSGATPAEVSAEYHHIREEEAEVEALNPHLDVP